MKWLTLRSRPLKALRKSNIFSFLLFASSFQWFDRFLLFSSLRFSSSLSFIPFSVFFLVAFDSNLSWRSTQWLRETLFESFQIKRSRSFEFHHLSISEFCNFHRNCWESAAFGHHFFVVNVVVVCSLMLLWLVLCCCSSIWVECIYAESCAFTCTLHSRINC